MKRFLILLLGMLFSGAVALAQQSLPPIEAYGDLEALSSMQISADGNKLAYIQRNDEKSILVITDLSGKNAKYAIGIGDLKVSGVSWAGSKHVILTAFETIRINGAASKTRYTGAYSVNIETKNTVQLLRGTDKLFPNQSGLGNIIGNEEGTPNVFMPAYIGARQYQPTYSLLRVDLDTGKGRMHSRGEEDGAGWLVDTDGTILARETYNNKSNQYVLETKRSGNWETVLDFEAERGTSGLVGVTPDRSALIVFLKNSKGYNELRRMDFDGEYSAPEMSRKDTEIVNVLRDTNNVVFGVTYGGLKPTYDFFDKALAADVKKMQDNAPQASVRLVSYSENFQRLIFYVSGSGFAGDYFMMDRQSGQISSVGSARPNIPKENIGEVLTIEYAATDGLKIPALMTIPNGSDMKNLPAIIMPHGGPEAHDSVGFDWMAQYFASRGYLVLQPNFRGSDGFGTAFTEAGYGGWGGVMQQDITDGVEALVDGGTIDPNRMCIVGWSYGGYAALAGGAFTPDLYKCVVAVAPVSDLPQLLFDEKVDHGKDHWVVNYWETAIARGDATRDTLSSKSPAKHADKFKAPVLLIHGKDDLVVKIKQSRRMKKALERADKDVELITMKGEDHSLSTRGARLEALVAMADFVDSHIGQ